MNKKTGASRQAAPANGRVKAYFAGLFSGLFVAFLASLLNITPASFKAAAGKPADTAASKPADVRSTTKFDFYTVLPEQEVVIADETAAAANASGAINSGAPGSANPAEPALTTVPPPAIIETPAATETRPAPITDLSQTAETAAAAKKAEQLAAAKPKSSVYLQAGSFRRLADADKRRAELLMYGMRATAEPVNSNGETWYRVQIGPFASDADVARARSKLKANGIETLMTRRK